MVPAAAVSSLQPRVLPTTAGCSLHTPVCSPSCGTAVGVSFAFPRPGRTEVLVVMESQTKELGGFPFFCFCLSRVLQSSFLCPNYEHDDGMRQHHPTTSSRPRVRETKDGPACPLAHNGCGRQWVPVLGSSRGGSWTTVSFLAVAQRIVSSNEGHGRCSQVVLGCHAVHDGLAAGWGWGPPGCWWL